MSSKAAFLYSLYMQRALTVTDPRLKQQYEALAREAYKDVPPDERQKMTQKRREQERAEIRDFLS